MGRRMSKFDTIIKMLDENIQKVIDVFVSREDTQYFSRLVSNPEIAEIVAREQINNIIAEIEEWNYGENRFYKKLGELF